MEKRLYRAIEERLVGDSAFAGVSIAFHTAVAVDWASLTFSGRRCEFDLIINARSDQDVLALANYASELLHDEWEACLGGGQLLADMVLVRSSAEERTARLRFEALIVDCA